MDTDKSFYQICGGLLIFLHVIWAITKGAVYVSGGNTVMRGYIYRDTHPSIFWFLIVFEASVAVYLLYASRPKKEGRVKQPGQSPSEHS